METAVMQLAGKLGCSQWTVKEAMKRPTKEGLLVSQGAGHRQRIVLPEDIIKPRALRVGIFLYERIEVKVDYIVDLQHLLLEAPLYLAVERHLGRLGFLSPRDVSLLCLDPSPVFRWLRPSVAHVHWDSRPMINRIVKWADNVARSKDDRRQNFTKAEFVEGGTLGSVPMGR